MRNSYTTKRLDRWFFIPAFALYMFVVQFGNFFRLSDAEVVPGLSTGIGFLIIGFGIIRMVEAVSTNAVFQALVFLIAWLGLASMFSETGVAAAYRLLGNFTGYVMIAAIASRTTISASQFRFIWIAASAGMALSAFLTVVDYVGIYNVPRNNDVVITSEVGSRLVEQATGFFPRRSAMAAVFSTVIAGSILIGILERRIIIKGLFWIFGSAGTLCVLLTHNRSGVLAALIALAIYAFALMPGGLIPRLKIGLAGAVAATLIIAVMWNYFPEHLEVYQSKLGHLIPGSEQSTPKNVAKSDFGRVRLFLAAVDGLAENPVGNGFGSVKLTGYGYKGSHNIITAFIWAAGVMFLLWLPLFLWFVYRAMRRIGVGSADPEFVPYIEATKCGLIAFVLNNMVHESWGTGAAWILFGLLLCMTRVADNTKRYR